MPLEHFSERHAIRLLATRSRQAELDPVDLAQVHAELGRYLGHALVEQLEVEPCTIQHPQGLRTGWRLTGGRDLRLLVFLRAGLYLGEGLRQVLREAATQHVTPVRGQGLRAAELSRCAIVGNTVILADAVINQGGTLIPVLRQLLPHQPRRLFVVSLVAPRQTAARLEQEFPEVCFLLARLSDNSYVGQGATDTGNRLFGTWDRDRQP